MFKNPIKIQVENFKINLNLHEIEKSVKILNEFYETINIENQEYIDEAISLLGIFLYILSIKNYNKPFDDIGMKLDFFQSIKQISIEKLPEAYSSKEKLDEWWKNHGVIWVKKEYEDDEFN